MTEEMTDWKRMEALFTSMGLECTRWYDAHVYKSLYVETKDAPNGNFPQIVFRFDYETEKLMYAEVEGLRDFVTLIEYGLMQEDKYGKFTDDAEQN